MCWKMNMVKFLMGLNLMGGCNKGVLIMWFVV